MRTVAIVQQRLGSTRRSRKSVAELAGHTLTYHVLRRIKQARGIDAVVLAVPDEGPDTQQLIDIGNSLSVPVQVVAGDPSDLLHRYTVTALAFKAGQVVRIPGDNPCTDPTEIERIIDHANANTHQWHYLYTNLDQDVLGNGYPGGLGAEVYDIRFLCWLNQFAKDPIHREHPHRWAFDNNHVRTVTWCPAEIARPTLKLSVDTQAELDFIRSIYAELGPDFRATDIVRLLDSREGAGSRAGGRPLHRGA